MELSINKVSIAFSSIGTKNYNRIDDSFDLIAALNVNGNESKISKRYKHGIRAEEMSNDFLKLTKDSFARNNYDSDMLKHNVVVIERFDDTEEKIISFAKKINDKIKDFKTFKKMSSFEMDLTMNGLNMNF